MPAFRASLFHASQHNQDLSSPFKHLKRDRTLFNLETANLEVFNYYKTQPVYSSLKTGKAGF